MGGTDCINVRIEWATWHVSIIQLFELGHITEIKGTIETGSC